jgi:cell division protease FtsH
MARAMIMEWGMSEKLGRVRYRGNEQEVFLGHSVAQSMNMSEETAKLIDEEVRQLVENAEQTARNILTEHKNDLDAIANGLLEYETLSGDEVAGLLKGIAPVRTPYEAAEPQRGPGPSVPQAGVPRGPIAAPEPQPGH